jgi:hypothetical protein
LTKRIEPYDRSEARIAQWIEQTTGMGGGEDPVGFILSSFSYKIQEMNQLRERLQMLEDRHQTAKASDDPSSETCVLSEQKIRQLRDRLGIGVAEAKRILLRQSTLDAIEQAASLNDIKAILHTIAQNCSIK